MAAKSRFSSTTSVVLPDGALDPSFCVFRHVTHVSRVVAAAYDQALAEVGMTAHQFNVLMTLHRMAPCAVGRIASVIGMHGSSVPRLVAPMAARSWITIEPGRDRRQRIIAIAPEGARNLARAIPLWARLQQSLLDEIGNDVWRRLVPNLKRVRDAAASVGARR